MWAGGPHGGAVSRTRSWEGKSGKDRGRRKGEQAISALESFSAWWRGGFFPDAVKKTREKVSPGKQAVWSASCPVQWQSRILGFLGRVFLSCVTLSFNFIQTCFPVSSHCSNLYWGPLLGDSALHSGDIFLRRCYYVTVAGLTVLSTSASHLSSRCMGSHPKLKLLMKFSGSTHVHSLWRWHDFKYCLGCPPRLSLENTMQEKTRLVSSN